MRGRPILPHRRKARCHPLRWAVKDGRCWACLHPQPQLQVIAEDRPAPPACPHCHTPPPGWHCDAFGGRCFICGQRWERAVEVVLV